MKTQIFTTLPEGNLILASKSVTRVNLLRDAGIAFSQYPVMVDEEAVRMAGIAEFIPASDIAVTLAEMKANAAYQRISVEKPATSACILGCDQILAFDNDIYRKPRNIDEAKNTTICA